MKIRFAAKSLSAAVLLMWGAAATAMPITWVLKDVMFADGGTATGSFVFDADPGVFSNIDITTSVNGSFGAVYGTPNPVSPGNSTLLIALAAFPPLASDLTGVPALALNFSTALTNLGGTIDIIPRQPGFSFEAQCASPSCSGPTGPLRDVTSGQVTTSVPEPGTLALFGLSLAGIGAMRRKRLGA
jgi:hypothetical protein